jgi:hypothetical protein
MFELPKKKSSISDDTFQHAVVLDAEKSLKFARVREVLGGYSNQELLELLVDKAIESYDDGQAPDPSNLPRKLQNQLPVLVEGE